MKNGIWIIGERLPWKSCEKNFQSSEKQGSISFFVVIEQWGCWVNKSCQPNRDKLRSSSLKLMSLQDEWRLHTANTVRKGNATTFFLVCWQRVCGGYDWRDGSDHLEHFVLCCNQASTEHTGDLQEPVCSILMISAVKYDQCVLSMRNHPAHRDSK